MATPQAAAAGPSEQQIQANAAAMFEQRRQRRYLVKALLRSPTFMTGLVIVLFWVFMALFSTFLTQSPTDIDAMAILQAPSAAHWFGTDDLGRDVLARTMAGARTVLVIAPLATILALLWGGIIGLVSGFYRGYTDEIIMRLVDVLLALPIIITSILVLSLLGKSVAIVIVVIGALFTPVVSRTIRAAVIGEREREYVMAARLRGERSAFVMAREILPNMTSLLVAQVIGSSVYAIGALVGLEFLGLGDVSSVTWGTNLYWASNDSALLTGAWWTYVPTGLCVALVGFGLVMLNSGFDEITNPRLQMERAWRAHLAAAGQKATRSTPVVAPHG